jgi:hypothetical protein
VDRRRVWDTRRQRVDAGVGGSTRAHGRRPAHRERRCARIDTNLGRLASACRCSRRRASRRWSPRGPPAQIQRVAKPLRALVSALTDSATPLIINCRCSEPIDQVRPSNLGPAWHELPGQPDRFSDSKAHTTQYMAPRDIALREPIARVFPLREGHYATSGIVGLSNLSADPPNASEENAPVLGLKLRKASEPPGPSRAIASPNSRSQRGPRSSVNCLYTPAEDVAEI